MARLRSLKPGGRKVRPRSLVDCEYQVVTTKTGERLLNLSTFGSDDRVSGPKTSQSIEIDEEMAAALVAVIRATFPKLK